MHQPDPQETFVPAGEYRIGFRHAERFIFAGKERIAVTFTITEYGKYFGKPLNRYLYFPRPGRSLSKGSNWYADYQIATGRRPPKAAIRRQPPR